MAVRRAVVGALVYAGLTLVGPAAAEPPGSSRPSVITPCPWLDPNELEAALTLELATVDEAWRAIHATYACEGEDVRIRLTMPSQSRVQVERDVANACCEEVERERTLALLTLGLLRATAPLLTGARTVDEETRLDEHTVVVPLPDEAPPPPPPLRPPTPALALSFARDVERPAFAFGLRPPPLSPPVEERVHDLGAGLSVAASTLEAAPEWLVGPRLLYRGWLTPRWALGGRFDAGFGQARRSGGVVDLRVFSLEETATARLWQRGRIRIVAGAAAGATWVELQGRSFSPTTEGESLRGASGVAAVGLGPEVAFGELRLSLPVEIGYRLRAPRGAVEGQSPVRLDGLFVGAQLVLWVGVGAPRMD
ncbi:MAG: hypothetical protein AAGA56_10935 [Myxococcota bacterium]